LFLLVAAALFSSLISLLILWSRRLVLHNVFLLVAVLFSSLISSLIPWSLSHDPVDEDVDAPVPYLCEHTFAVENLFPFHLGYPP
jgi:hypothetical protein